MTYCRLITCLWLALFLIIAAGCGDEDEEKKDSIVNPDDTTDSVVIPDTSFSYTPTTPPSVLAQGYRGILKMTREDQGYPIERTDTVALLVPAPDQYRLLFISRHGNLCDSEGGLDFGEGDLTVFLTDNPMGSFCDTLRLPYGPFASTYTESTLQMDSSRYVITVNQDVETVRHEFDLTAFNLFDSYRGWLSIDSYIGTNVTSYDDSVTITITDSVYELTAQTAGGDICSVTGNITLDPVVGTAQFDVDSVISDTMVCDASLAMRGLFGADYHYNGALISGTKYAPISGSSADSMIIRLDLAGM